MRILFSPRFFHPEVNGCLGLIDRLTPSFYCTVSSILARWLHTYPSLTKNHSGEMDCLIRGNGLFFFFGDKLSC